MNFNNNEMRMLTREEVFGSQKIDIIDKMGTKCAVSDFAILLGANVSDQEFALNNTSLKSRTTTWFLASQMKMGVAFTINTDGHVKWTSPTNRFPAIRPVLEYQTFSDELGKNSKEISMPLEIEFGEYPQYAVSPCLAQQLEASFLTGNLQTTGKTYTIDARKINEFSLPFAPQIYLEYTYNGKKYIRTKYTNPTSYKLTNGQIYHEGDLVWLEVSPLKWLLSPKSQLLISKTSIVSGIRFNGFNQTQNFSDSETYQYLNTYLIKDIMSSNLKKDLETSKLLEEQAKLEEMVRFYQEKLRQTTEELNNLKYGRLFSQNTSLPVMPFNDTDDYQENNGLELKRKR